MRSRSLIALAAASTLAVASCGARPAAAPKTPVLASHARVALPSDLFTSAPAAIQFTSSDVGYVLRPAADYQVGGGVLLRTADGARTWQTIALPKGFMYQGMRFFNTEDGVLFGENTNCGMVQPNCLGAVFWTGDGGRSFREVLRTPDSLFGASAAWSATGGWISAANLCMGSCAAETTLYGTSDGGLHWSSLTKMSSQGFAVLSTADGRTGYGLLGGDLVKTTDGGRSFAPVATLPSGHQGPISAVSGSLQQLPGGPTYITACDGGAANGGCMNYVYRSQSGAAPYQSVWSRYCTDQTAVHMQSALSGVLVLMGTTACGPGGGIDMASNIVLATSDGFRTTHLAYAFKGSIDAVQFVNQQDGWAVGTGAQCYTSVCPMLVYRTTDGGLQWTPILQAQEPLGTVARAPGGPYFGIGTALDPGAVLASSNGRTWHKVGEIPEVAAATVTAGKLQFASARQGYLLLPNGLYRTVNGGRNWSAVPAVKGSAVVAMSFLGPDLGYVLTQSGKGCPIAAPCHDKVVVTRDGGRQFTEVTELPKDVFFSSIAFVSRSVGYAFGLCPVGRKCGPRTPLWRTTDGGIHWRQLRLRLPQSGFGGAIYPAPGGYAVGVFNEGFAVLVPGIGWRSVEVGTSSPGTVPPLGDLGPAGVVPGRNRALVSLSGIGVFDASYQGGAWTSH